VADLVDEPVFARVQGVHHSLTRQLERSRIHKLTEGIGQSVRFVQRRTVHIGTRLEEIIDETLGKDRTVKDDVITRRILGREKHLGKEQRIVEIVISAGGGLVGDDLVHKDIRGRDRVHRCPSHIHFISQITFITGVQIVGIWFTKDVIAIVIPVALQTTEIEIGRNIGGTSGRVIGASDIPRGDHVRIAGQEHELHTPALIRFTDEVADRFLDVTAVPVIGFDPLDGLHHGRQAESGLVIRQWRERRCQGFVGDDQVAHGATVKARRLARIETTSGFGHGDPVFP